MNLHRSKQRFCRNLLQCREFSSIPKDKYVLADISKFKSPKNTKYDSIVIGGGHNGLVTAAYLAKAGLSVLVLERRKIVGGAAVTEEIVKGFKFSRGSYLAGLLRPQIIEELELKRHGFQYLQRTPSSFTPTISIEGHPNQGRYLMLGNANIQDDLSSISQFSGKDAKAYIEYESFLSKVRELLQPLLDMPPPEISLDSNFRQILHTMKSITTLLGIMWKHRDSLAQFYELMLGPAKSLLDRYFESNILKATLATDAVIGAVTSPSSLGSAYVLVHHVMGQCDGRAGVWAYVKGGMGAVSDAIAAAALEHGAEIVCNANVDSILYSMDGKSVEGVVANGHVLKAPIVVSAATPYTTFLELNSSTLSRATSAVKQIESPLPLAYLQHLKNVDYTCGALKINLAVKSLPNFTCFPSPASGLPGPMHKGTIHFESTVDELEIAYREARDGFPASIPIIEMTIPSALDTTISPPGCHVVQLFINYAPYDLHPSLEGGWDATGPNSIKSKFVKRIYDRIDQFAPGFSESIIGEDILTPRDLERIFGLHRGNIHHASLSLHQLFWGRPKPGYSNYRTPINGFYLSGSGTHPGGGVQGAPGRNAARVILNDKGLNV